MGTDHQSPEDGAIHWRRAGLRYYAYGFHLRRTFGERVHRVSVDAGFTCPNVDGTVAVGGCTFCDNRSFSPSRRLPRMDIRDQMEEGMLRLRRRFGCRRFLAYFQPATNTYAPVDRLRRLYERALSHPDVVGLIVGTRPDCVPDEVLDLLQELGRNRPVEVEYGVQTIHNGSLDWMNRGHHYDAFVGAMERSRGRGLTLGAHVILGLPTESPEDMMATARELSAQQPHAVKIHNLYAVHNTPLADQVRRGEVELLDRATYVRLLVDFLERLRPDIVVERVGGDAPPEYLVGPDWCLDRPGLRLAVEREFLERDTWQGRLAEPLTVR